jgi:hypothetical protein
MTPVETLISYFESGAFPNATQFKELIQSLWHKSERIPIEQIESLVGKLNTLLETETFNGTVQDLVNDISIKLEKGTYNGTADDLHREIQSILDGSGKTYLSISEAMAVLPLPSDNTPFRIKNNPAGVDDGDYIYLSTEANGYKFFANSLAQDVDENNTTEPVSGSAVFGHSNKTFKNKFGVAIQDIERNFFSIFNGVDTTVNLDQSYILENEGDSIEFTFSVDDFSDSKGMGIMGELGSHTSHIGFFTNKLLYIREVDGAWLTTDGFLTTTQPDEEHTLKLEWLSSEIAVYKDGVFQKNIPTGTLRIENIGNSYSSFFQGKIRDVKIKSGVTLVDIGTPYFLSEAENLDLKPTNKGYLTNEQLNELLNIGKNKNRIESIVDFYNKSDKYYTRYNGDTSETLLDKTYTLSEDGDYIEIEMRLHDGISNFNDGLGCFGVKGVNFNTFGFYDSDSIWFRADGDSAYSQVNGLNGFEKFAKYKLQVVNNSTQYEVFKDGQSVGVFNKENDFQINNIGFGYTAGAKIDVKSVNIHTDTDTFDTNNTYFLHSTATNVDLVLGEQNTLNSNKFSKCYVSYNPIGYNGNEKFTVYVQNEANPKYYYGFEIAHEINTDEIVYMDQYRLQIGKVYEFDGEIMINTGQVALTLGESEYVYQTANKVDFTGGYHGDEKLINVDFYIDGVRLTDLTTAFDLKACSDFAYIQKSTMHETAADGDIVNPAHPIEAEHYKHSMFSNSGYTTRTKMIGKKVGGLEMTVNYGSIVCLSREFGGNGQTDNYNIEGFDTNGGHKLNEVNDNVHTWNEANNTSAKVTSKFNVRNGVSYQFIWDTMTYNKYYRDLCRTTGQAQSLMTLAENEVWEFETKVKFAKS